MAGASVKKAKEDTKNEDEILTYEKSGILGIKGELYQAKLLMLFLYRGVQYQYDFLLATEMVNAEKFDDIVFRYLDDGKIVYRFLQAKHVADETKLIQMAELVNEGDKNFGLLKYFNSYRKIKANPSFEREILKEFAICTNIAFDEDCLDSFELIEEIDDILDLEETRGYRFHFKKDFQDKVRINDLLRKVAPVNRVANQLAKSFLFADVIEEDQVKYIDLKKYYKFVVRKIVNITNQRFYEEFLNPCEKEKNDIKIFRKVFLEEICRESNKLKEPTSKKKYFLELNNDEDILSQIKKANRKLNLSKSFKQKYQMVTNKTNSGEFQFQKLDITNDEEINIFLEKLVFAVNQPNEDELGKIIEKEIGKEFALISSAEAVYNKLFIQMLNWMKSNEGCFFSHKEGSNFFKEARRGLSVWFDVLPPSEYFTGRTRELQELHTLLQRGSLVPCVVGLGGIGKSETVRKYIQEHSQDYDHNVVWIHAEDRSELEESFIRLAKDFLNISVEDMSGKLKDIKSIIASVYAWFSNKKSLFVFDNAVKFKATADEGIDIFLPNVPKNTIKPSVIITSRNQEWSESKFKKIIITVFTKNDAENFIRLALNDAKEGHGFKLSETLQYFPLAMQQSIAYIKQVDKEVSCIDPDNKFTILDYLEEFDRKTKELLNFQFSDDFCDSYTKTTFTTWNVTVDRIKKNKENGSIAIELFYIISYFAPENIPTLLLKKNVGNDIRKLGAVLSILKKYSLIDLQKGLINIHRLVQLVNRIVLDESGEERSTVIKCVESLEDYYPSGDTTEDCSRMRTIIPHLEKVLIKVDELSDCGKRSVEERHVEALLRCLGNAYGNLGSILKEKEICERRVQFAKDRYGETDPRTAHALVCLGTAWGDLGHHEKQDEFIKKAVDIFNARGIDRSIALKLSYCTSIADAFVRLGTSCRHLGKFAEAKEYLEQALFITEKLHGTASHKYAHVLGSLALVYGSLGDNQTEIDMLERSLPSMKSYYGKDHFHVGALYGKLGAAYSDINKQREALHFLEESLRILERHYGPDHYQVGQTLGDMGIAYMALGQFSEAKEKLEKYLETFESHFGPENAELEAPLSNLAFVLGCLNERERQIALLKRLLEVQINIYGPQHRKISATKNMIETARLGLQFFGRLGSGLKIFK